MRIRLLETYQDATQAYADEVEKLRRQMGTMDKPEYDALYRITEELRLGATGAREELNAHVRLHGCCLLTALRSLTHRSDRFGRSNLSQEKDGRCRV